MKLAQAYLIAVLTVVVSAVSAGATGEALSDKRVVQLVTGDNYPPYVDRDLDGGGWVTAGIKSALEKGGFHVEPLKWWPWKRGLEETRAGNTDGTFPWGYTDERARDVLYSKPLFFNSAYAWIRKGSEVSPEKPPSRGFCLPLGYVEFGRTKDLVEKHPQSRVSVPSMKQCFLMLSILRTDMVISTPNDAEAAMTAAGLDRADFVRVEPHMHRITYHFIVERNRPFANDIIAAVNQWFEVRASADPPEASSN